MAKSSSIFICQNCEASFPKWMGQCGDCGEWNSLVEEVVAGGAGATGGVGGKKVAGRGSSAGKKVSKAQLADLTTSFSQVSGLRDAKARFSTSIGELDRVLGGGLVAGMVVLVGGEPGIGKSTLLTQMLIGIVSMEYSSIPVWQYGEVGVESKNGGKRKNALPKLSKLSSSSKNKIAQKKSSGLVKRRSGVGPILFVSGEESPSQISLRINRILENEQFIYHLRSGKVSGEEKNKKNGSDKLKKALDEQLVFVTSTDVDEIISVIKQNPPHLVIVDSIQTLTTDDLTGASGSVGQLRESTDRIVTAVKKQGVPTFLVGHVTKDGNIAGPKVLEHIVDSVLEISGERTGQLRLIRSLKNRFGATDEVGVFKLVEYGLEEVTNPSELFLEHQGKGVAGSAIACVMEGTRPLLVEVQALVVRSQLAMPRRVGRGIELSRIQVLSAVLQKHGKLPLSETDIFLSAAGGFRIKEPAVDLGLAMAIASSLKNKKLPQKTIFIGEIGLLGEIRAVSYLERRIKEAKRLGYKNIISRDTHSRVMDVLREMGV